MFVVNIKTMDVKEKQKFEASFNYIGDAMATAFEKADKERKKQIGNYIKCINQMYIYTNSLETQLLTKKYKDDTTFRRKRIQQERIVKKNDRR